MNSVTLNRIIPRIIISPSLVLFIAVQRIRHTIHLLWMNYPEFKYKFSVNDGHIAAFNTNSLNSVYRSSEGQATPTPVQYRQSSVVFIRGIGITRSQKSGLMVMDNH
jgi:hypothetical protein